MKSRMLAVVLCVCLFAVLVLVAQGEGLLPTLSNAYGNAMPSLTEALCRYPASEENVGGISTEHWTNITEDDFITFGVYLKQNDATLLDYQVEGSVFSATVTKAGGSFVFVFDTNTGTADITYAATSYDDRLFAVKSIWNAAEEAETAGRYSEAAEKYASLIRYEGAAECYRDSDQRELRCYYAEGEMKRDAKDWEGAVKAFGLADKYGDAATQVDATRYAEGEARRDAKDWEGAVKAFGQAGKYSDAATQITETCYQQASSLLTSGDTARALTILNGIKGYKKADSLLEEVYAHVWDLIKENKLISALKLLRMVDEEKYNELHARIESFLCSLYVPYWKVQYVLKPNGTVVNFNGNIVENNVTKISYHVDLFALKNDGTVVSDADWENTNFNKWKSIVDIQSAGSVCAGLKKDGTVVAEWRYDGEQYEQMVEKWRDIKQIAVCVDMVYGLKRDGTVVEAGKRYDRFKSVKDWKNIVEIFSDDYHFYGRKSDKTIVSNTTTIEDNTTWANILYKSSQIFAQVNSDGTTPIKELTDEGRKLLGDDVADMHRYLHNATNCLALPRNGNAYGIIKDNGTLVLIKESSNGVDAYVSETPWKLWNNEIELGKLYNRQYRIEDIYVRPASRINLESGISSTLPEQTTTPTPDPGESKQSSFCNVGDYITFGSYEQDNNMANGQEPIEWLVLDYDAANNRALLLSRYGLDAQPYNIEHSKVTWEKCTLRTWLNGTFLNKAFTAQEKARIEVTNVDNSNSQGYSQWRTKGGKNTKDKVFLLSYAEVNHYLGVTYNNSRMTSRITPTAYAVKQGASTYSSTKTAGWWLRSPGRALYGAARVNADGSLGDYNVSLSFDCVRPALWIDLESDIF